MYDQPENAPSFFLHLFLASRLEARKRRREKRGDSAG